MTALALVEETTDERCSPDVHGVPTQGDLETLDEAIAEIDRQLAGACLRSVELRDRREDLLAGRAALRRRRERAGLFEEGALVRFYGIEYVGTAAEYEEHDPNLMRGDGWRQVWPAGALEKIRRVNPRRRRKG